MKIYEYYFVKNDLLIYLLPASILYFRPHNSQINLSSTEYLWVVFFKYKATTPKREEKKRLVNGKTGKIY